MSRRTVARTMFVVCVGLSAWGSADATDVDAKERLQRLFDQYARIQTLHFEADYRSTFSSSADRQKLEQPTVIARTSSYWMVDGGLYRGRTETAPYDEFPGSIYEFGFNGSTYQFLDRPASIFSFGRANEIAQNPASLENPIFTPVSFLSKDVDGCRACVLTLPDILNAQSQSAVLSAVKVISAPGDAELVIELPGGILLERPFTFQLHFAAVPDYLPSRIVWMTASGPLKTSDIEYQRFELESGEMYWPKKVHGLATPGKDISDELMLETRLIEINKTLPEGIFDIDFSSATSVWNYDTKSFVK